MAEQTPPNLRVFISYARSDASDFAEELLVGLRLIGFDPFLDRHDIAGGEDWEARLGGLIQAADTVVFVVSPAAVASDRCAWEVMRALALKKRIIPVVAIDVPEADTPASLAKLNYIFFSQGHSFTRALEQLGETLRVDLDWIREHTRLAELAARWRERDQAGVLLLRGSELDAAKEWLAGWKAGAPEPTDLHRAFLAESEAAEESRESMERKRLEEMAAAQAERELALQRLSRRTLLGLIGAGGLTATAGGLAYWGVNAERRFTRERAEREEAERRSIDALIEREAARRDIAGQFTAYAAAPGEEALDSTLYSDTLLDELSDESASLQTAMARAQARVFRESANLTVNQRPYFSSDLNGEIYLHRPSPTRLLKALVVGVDNVSEYDPLQFVEAEVDAWTDTLRSFGFETMRLANPSVAELQAALEALGFPTVTNADAPKRGRPSTRGRPKALEIAKPAVSDALAFFFYAGYGFSLEGETFIPSPDFDPATAESMRASSTSVSAIQRHLRDSAAASILMLDASFAAIQPRETSAPVPPTTEEQLPPP